MDIWVTPDEWSLPNMVGARFVHIITDAWSEIEESDETNNLSEGHSTTLSTATVDLEPTSITVPANASRGSPLTVNLTIQNTGSDPATGVNGQLYGQVYISTDQQFDAPMWDNGMIVGDEAMGGFLLEGLAPLDDGTSAMTSLEFSPLGDLDPNTDYFIIVDVNGAPFDGHHGTPQQQAESNVANNVIVSSTATRIGPPAADLVVTAAGAGAASGDALTTVDVNWTVRNQGSQTAGTTSTDPFNGLWWDRVYLSNDATLDDDDTPVTITSTEYGDDYLNRAESLAAGADYTRMETILLPDRSGSHLIFVANANQSQPEADNDNNTFVVPFTVNHTPSDLVITNAQIVSGTLAPNNWITVEYTLHNNGPGDATVLGYHGAWNDYFYLSQDSELQTQTDYQATSNYQGQTLAAGASRTMSVSIYLPSGTQYDNLLIHADFEGYNASLAPVYRKIETDETNNLFVLPIPYPSSDLVVASASLDPAMPGGTDRAFDLTYTIDNQGTTATSEFSWYDYIYYSTDNQFDPQSDTLLRDLYIYSGNTSLPIAAGGSYSQTVSLTLPTSAASGNGWLFVQTDRFDAVNETDDDNNVFMKAFTAGRSDLRVDSADAELIPTMLGDLGVPDFFTPDAATPFEFRLGENVTLSALRTLHEGTAPASVTFTLKDSQGSVLGSWPATQNGSDPNLWEVTGLSLSLVPGSYTVEDSEPAAWLENAYDSDRGVAQVAFTPDRSSASPVQVIQGETVRLNWAVTNADSNALSGNWYDAWYLSTDNTFDKQQDTQIDSFFQSHNPLSGSTQYMQSEELDINAPGGGTVYLFLVTDNNSWVLETSETNNVSAPIAVEIVAPDLVASSFSAPSSLIVGKPFLANWMATNSGSATTTDSWHDGLYLSDDAVWDSNDFAITSFDQSGRHPLPVSGTYSNSESVTLGGSAPLGQKYLIFKLNDDSYYRFGEFNESNNTMAVMVTVAAPDLVVSEADAPATISWGENIRITWDVTNNGSVEAAQTWSDYIYLSDNPTYESGSDTYLGNVFHSNDPVLGAGSSYSEDYSFSFSQSVTGDRYLLIVTDRWNNQGETDENNNLRAIPIRVNDPPDLAISDANAPDSGSPGGAIEVDWTVASTGGPAGGTWSDTVFLSSDNVWDSSDTQLYSQGNLGVDLASGQTALIFDDGYSWVETPLNLNQTSAGNGVTLEAWVYPFSSDSYESPVISTSFRASNYDWSILHQDGTWRVYNGAESLDTGIAVDLNQWQHVAAVFDPDTGIAFYKSGESTPYTSPQIDFTNDDEPVNVVSFANYRWYGFDGMIDDVRAWSSARTGPEIAAARDGSLAGDEAGLEGWWKFNEGQGAAAADSSPNGRHATLTGDSPEYTPAWISEGSYTVNRLVDLPGNAAAGAWFLIFWTDRYGHQPESDNDNNRFVVPLSIESADLTVSNPSAPATASAGDSITVTWQVANSGSGSANSTYWYDRVYLSDDNVFDNGDQELASYYRDNSGGLAADALYDGSRTFNLPNDALGSKFILIVADANGNQGETNETNNVASVAISLNAPDLVIISDGADAPTAPTQAVLGESIALTWSAKNISEHATNVSWYDRIYLSIDNQWDESDTLLGSAWNSSVLAPSEQYDRSYSVTLPETDAQGAVYLLFFADGSNSQGETDETNNVVALNIQIAAPDLTVTDITAPASASLGETIDFSWTVQSAGQPANRDWYDWVYFSTDATLDGSDQRLATYWTGNNTPISADGSYTETRSLTLPANSSGTYHLLVKTDGSRDQGESNEGNNLAFHEIQLQAPDLAAERITVPTALTSSQQFQVSYRIGNPGNAPALALWTDAIYFSNDAQFDPGTDILLDSFSAAGRVPLASGEAYSGIRSVRLPAAAAGTYYLLLVADKDETQGESDESNNVAVSAALTVSVPDLTPTGFTTPASAAPNQTIPVSWTISNPGPVAAPGLWQDRVYLSSDDVFDPDTDTLLLSHDHGLAAPVAAGGSYAIDANVNLPAIAVGTYRLILVANGNEAQGESNLNNNVLVGSPLQVEAPDLSVTDLQAPTSVSVQQTVSITWTVHNAGPGAAGADRYDAVYLSNNDRLTGDDLRVTGFDVSNVSPVLSGDSYTLTREITIPADADATYNYLILVTDDLEEQGESDEANNERAIAVTITPPPDLKLIAQSTPAAAAVGQWIDVAWTVANDSSTMAFSDWVDRVYLSDDNQFDGADLLLASSTINAQTPLAADQNYSVNVQAQLPAQGVGTKYLIIRVDADDQQTESVENANNFVVRAITISDPDLVVTASTAPTAASWGQRVTVEWTVSNQGSGAATGTWHDRVYISQDDQLDTASDLLALEVHAGGFSPLDPNATYTLSREITLPSGLTGTVHFLFVTDARETQTESNETNNVQPHSQSTSFNAADLEITDHSTPTTAAWGERIDVSWTVTNNGNGEALSGWWDYLYLSSDNQFDSNADTYLASRYHYNNEPLAPDAAYTVSLNGFDLRAIPASAGTGSQFLILITDVYNSQAESDDADNQIALPLEIRSANLTAGQSNDIPAAVDSGKAVDLTWNVTNAGSGHATTGWADAVFLSTDDVLDDQDLRLGTFSRNDALAAGDAYSATGSITIPSGLTGSRYLLVVFDYYNNLPRRMKPTTSSPPRSPSAPPTCGSATSP